ncbi:MAG: 23S rRNA (pseudouridine(1915)-N(3))-methyltransferase RlmH [Eggerthellaceae bacterium]|nr:23S rRNA (pseudouridine(1915)-N(3))-methyltransferase RlmH [Eggerthellaceae bacterium]
MNITVIAVGKLKEAFWVSACAEYLKRLSSYAKVSVREVADVDPARVGGDAAAVAKEGEGVLAAIRALPERTHVVLLDIRGKERSSEALAARLEELAVGGVSDVAFVIGGSCGVGAAVRARADETLSFGPITLPHNLARVVLLEQIYRAFRINRGEPYHK